MSGVQPEINLDDWIEFSSKLSASQNFLLIGLLSRTRFTSLGLVEKEPLETEENFNDAEKWLTKYLRQTLKIHCDNYKKFQVEVALQTGKSLVEASKEFITAAATAIAYTTSGVKVLE
jgi:hypothetical protein